MSGSAASDGGDGQARGALQSAIAAGQARDAALYNYKLGQTVFERFDIPPPGGIRMLNMLIECYEV
jgi:hypothetical protein